MGATSAVAFRLWVGIVDDAGTLRPAVVNCAATDGILPLQPHMIVTTSGTPASAVQTIYSGTAATAKPFIPVAYIDFDSGLTTAGTWVLASVTKLQLWSPGMPLPGDTVREWFYYDKTGGTSTSTSLVDVTNGAKAIAPSMVNNPIAIDAGVAMFCSLSSGANNIQYDDFWRDSTSLSGTDCFAAGAGSGVGGLQAGGHASFRYLDYRRSVSSTTYKWRHRALFSASVSSANISIHLRELMG